MEPEIRSGEARAHPFRSARVFHANGAWYFSTREGTDIGPFVDRQEAEAALLEFLREMAVRDQRIITG